jgi:hypothetical protein
MQFIILLGGGLSAFTIVVLVGVIICKRE